MVNSADPSREAINRRFSFMGFLVNQEEDSKAIVEGMSHERGILVTGVLAIDVPWLDGVG